MGSTVDLYVPVVTASVICHSRLLDDMSEFTKFILWNIGSGNSLEDVDEVIALNRDVIEDEVEYLVTHKLLEEDEITLTVLGEEYYQLILCMENLSEKGIPAIIDLYSGKVTLETTPVAIYSSEDIPQGAVMLEDRVSRLFFRNDNYSNSREAALEYLSQEDLLRSEYWSSIYTTISLKEKHGENTRYAVRVVSCDCLRVDPEKEYDGGDNWAAIGIPVSTYRFANRYLELDPYRPLLGQLWDIHKDANELLSRKALHLLELDTNERQTPEKQVVVDSFSCEDITAYTDLTLVDRKDSKVPILPSKRIRMMPGQENLRYEQTGVDNSKIYCIKINYEEFPYRSTLKSRDEGM